MKAIKSERLRKLEAELQDMEQWLSLGLVPKKDIEKHKEEMGGLSARIDEERERLQFLKEGGEVEEFVVPKRNQAKPGYNEMPTIPDLEGHDSSSSMSEGGFDMETYVSEDSSYDEETSDELYGSEADEEKAETAEEEESEEEEESYFSEKNRWKRGGIVDPDADEW